MSSWQRRPHGRRRVALAGAGAVVLAVAGCTSSGSNNSDSPSPQPSATVAPTPSLSKFYSQKLDWAKCANGQCAKLKVPVDYSKPDGQTIEIAVKKIPATGKREGSLVVNPGGPGASGVDYINDPNYVIGKSVQKAYDLVGFDPRGVARSAPIDCYDDKQMDKMLGSDPTPDDAAEQNAMMAGNRDFGKACQAKAGNLLGHVSTVEAAKDMDVLRAALGSAKLDYLGKSYGTLLGATYADQFPTKVGRFVLDGVVNPADTGVQSSLGQAIGFERATKSYIKDCVAQGNCPLGNSEQAATQKLQDLLKSLDSKPIPVSGYGDVKQLTEGWATTGLALALYDKNFWPMLTEALRQALAGDGNGMMELAGFYADREKDGKYNGNTLEAINAVNCLDRQGNPDVKSYEKLATDFSKQAPIWGDMIAWGNAVCGAWPVKATGAPKKITAEGAPTILIIGTTRDPATPYENSVKLHESIKNSRLISFDGDGHTAYLSSQNKCVDNTVDAFLVKGTVPSAQDTKC